MPDGATAPDAAVDLSTAFDSNSATTAEQTMQEISDIFGFGDSSTTTSSVGTLDGEEAGQSETQPVSTSPNPPATPAAPPVAQAPAAPVAPATSAPAAQPAAPTAPTAAELELAALKDRLAKLEAPAPAPDAETSKTKPEGAAPDGEGNLAPIAYKGQLPNDVMGAIFGEDPQAAAQAMNGIVNSLATHLHTTFRAELGEAVKMMEERFGQRLQSIMQTDVASQQQNAVQEAETDYYSNFPNHKNPLYAGIIGQCSSQLAVEYPDLKWGEKFRNALGDRVEKQLLALGITPTAANVAAPITVDTPQLRSAASPAAPAAFVPSGNRAPSGDNEDAGNLISDTLGF